MTELKCPICNIPLERIGDLFQCPNDHCGYVGNEELWQELITTRKALDIAINVLNRVKDVKYEEYIDEKLEQIESITKGIEYVSADLGC